MTNQVGGVCLHKSYLKGIFKTSHEILKPKNPIRHVAIKRYCECKYPQKIVRKLSSQIKINIQQIVRWIAWTESIL